MLELAAAKTLRGIPGLQDGDAEMLHLRRLLHRIGIVEAEWRR